MKSKINKSNRIDFELTFWLFVITYVTVIYSVFFGFWETVLRLA